MPVLSRAVGKDAAQGAQQAPDGGSGTAVGCCSIHTWCPTHSKRRSRCPAARRTCRSLMASNSLASFTRLRVSAGTEGRKSWEEDGEAGRRQRSGQRKQQGRQGGSGRPASRAQLPTSTPCDCPAPAPCRSPAPPASPSPFTRMLYLRRGGARAKVQREARGNEQAAIRAARACSGARKAVRPPSPCAGTRPIRTASGRPAPPPASPPAASRRWTPAGGQEGGVGAQRLAAISGCDG